MKPLIFRYQEDADISDLTTFTIKNETWFSAPDVCQLLELDNVTKALYPLDDDEKLTLPVVRAGQKRAINFVNESGLYSLIFKSRKESAKAFKKWVTKEVIPSIRRTGHYGTVLPDFIIRYNDNWHKISDGYFSVITELFTRLYMRFEKAGYIIPEKSMTGCNIMPDISVGKGFAHYLDIEYPLIADAHATYTHTFPDGRQVEARQYPNALLEVFIKYIDKIWIPQCAEKYFKERDKKALEYLPKLLGLTVKK
jgi:hypothetical protein